MQLRIFEHLDPSARSADPRGAAHARATSLRYTPSATGALPAAVVLIVLYVPYAAAFGDAPHTAAAMATFGGLAATAWAAGRARPARAAGKFVQAGWPLAWWPVLYPQAVSIVELARSRYVDPALLRFDAALFGWPDGHPPVSWLGGPAEELANGFYVSYYVVVPVGLLVAWGYGRTAAARYSTAVLWSFTACAALWLIVPSGGLHPSGSPVTAPWGPFTAICREIYRTNPHYAAAFPSSHAAVAFAAGVALLRLDRAAGGRAPWRRWSVLWAAGVAYATVAGQYHYSVDAVAGALVGTGAALAATAPARHIARRPRRAPVSTAGGRADHAGPPGPGRPSRSPLRISR